ncbi:MAG: amidohydrolase family protein [Gemmatimonadales bacterium]
MRLLLLVCATLGCVASEGAPPDTTFDLIVRGGRVMDGSSPWIRADLGIRGDRIVAIGDLSDAAAARVIEARDRYVVPGFIDVHSHAGPGLAEPTLAPAAPLLAQGITTVAVNPDGGGPTDLAAQRRELERGGVGVNVMLLVPHGSIRRAVIGMEDRAATRAELDRMRELTEEGMRAGAFGLSSGPYYAPGSYASTEELIALARVAADFGGLYTSHIRDESDYSVGLLAAVDEVIRIAEAAKLPGVVTHVKALGPRVWGLADAVVSRIDSARARGIEIFADQYPYEASSTSLAAALVPRWAQVGGDTAMVRRLDDPDDGPRIRAAMVENLARRGGADRQMISRHPADRSLEGRTLAQIARERAVSPIDAAASILRADGAGIVSFNMNEDDIATFMRQDWTMTSSDGTLVPMGEGVPHPRAYGTFPRKLRRYVVEGRVVSLEDAIRSMTSLPAAVFRLGDRGNLRVGARADVVVLDLGRVRDVATYQEPHQLAAGIEVVVVNGGVAWSDGGPTDRRYGRVLEPVQTAMEFELRP